MNHNCISRHSNNYFVGKCCFQITCQVLIVFTVELLLYAPKRPIVDFSVVFLWMMAVGTVACAALWPEITAERTEERYNELSAKVRS